MEFREESHSRVLLGVADAATRVAQEHGQKRIAFVAGRSRRLATDSTAAELREILTQHGTTLGQDVPKSLGDVGAALLASVPNGSLLVLQAAP